MTQRTTETPATVPTVITILQEGTTLAGKVRHRGEVIEITDDLYRDTIDRNGDSILQLDERRQVERWKRALWKVGNHRASLLREQESQRKTQERTDPALEALRSEWALEDAQREKSSTSSRTTGTLMT